MPLFELPDLVLGRALYLTPLDTNPISPGLANQLQLFPFFYDTTARCELNMGVAFPDHAYRAEHKRDATVVESCL